jgi:hypothetical protein
VLSALNILQLVLYIPLLALLGQGVLYVLAGAGREQNFFYQLLQLVARPFAAAVRRLTPASVADRHVPVVTFFLLVIAYVIVTVEKIGLCVRVGMELCR